MGCKGYKTHGYVILMKVPGCPAVTTLARFEAGGGGGAFLLENILGHWNLNYNLYFKPPSGLDITLFYSVNRMATCDI